MSQASKYITTAIGPTIPISFETDAGTATAALNVIQLLGGTNTSTSAAGNIVLIDSTASPSPLTTKGDLYTFSTLDARLPVGTDGQVLSANSAETTGLKWIAASSASGTVTNVSGTANQVAVATGTTTPVISLVGPYTPSTYTTHGVLVGAGTSSIVALAAGTANQVLQSGGAGADPAYSTATYPATTTINQVLYSSANNTISEITTAIDGVMITSHTGVPSILANSGTAGWVLTANSGAPPSWQASGSSGGLTWSVITADQNITVANGYICNKAGLLTLTLPASASIGDIFEVTGINSATGWKVAQNANQQIFFGNQSTTIGVGGSLASTAIRDSIKAVCVVSGASSVYNIVTSVGNITIV